MTTALTTTCASDAPALPSRPKPLERGDFDKLEYHVKRCFNIRPRFGGENYNVLIGHEVSTVEGQHVPASLLDSVHRPAQKEHVGYHLTRLSAHKKNTKDKMAFKIIIEDLAYDLNGCSEWALFKACEEFRKGSNPFFPDTHDIIAAVKRWQAVANRMGQPEPPPPPKTAPEFVPDPPKYRRRFIQWLKLLTKKDKTVWETRWCAAFQRVVEEKHAREKKQG